MTPGMLPIGLPNMLNNKTELSDKGDNDNDGQIPIPAVELSSSSSNDKGDQLIFEEKK